MPVFLDRHDFFQVTAVDIAQIHMEDIKIQQEFGCWVLAYWCDQKRKTTFCLIEAPDLESVKEMHWHVHHSYPHQIIQVEEDLIDSFLRYIQSPILSSKQNIKSPLVTKPVFCAVLVVKPHCNETPVLNETIKNMMVQDYTDCSKKIIKRMKGRIVKSGCEGCIYSFDSISRSIKSALQIQHEMGLQTKRKGVRTFMLSFGISGKKQMNDDCDLLLETTNHALRLCGIAGKDQIVISSTVREQLKLDDIETLMKNCSVRLLNYKEEHFLNRLMDIIELHYRDDFKIEHICKILGESRSQLYRKSINVTKLSPIELINEFRLKKATELMHTQNGNNISQIAFEAGFNSLSYFSRRFKKRFGSLPSTYINRT